MSRDFSGDTWDGGACAWNFRSHCGPIYDDLLEKLNGNDEQGSFSYPIESLYGTNRCRDCLDYVVGRLRLNEFHVRTEHVYRSSSSLDPKTTLKIYRNKSLSTWLDDFIDRMGFPRRRLMFLNRMGKPRRF